ncbi:MAG: hypothetical protein IKK42_06055, partial [Oscillospiraceae bacterium]|nr:hypothetical protein [Oscillospiraceae bacterium]
NFEATASKGRGSARENLSNSSEATVKDALSYRASLFRNTVAKFTLAERFSGGAAAPGKSVALCGGRQWGVAPLTPTKGSTAPFGNPKLGATTA